MKIKKTILNKISTLKNLPVLPHILVSLLAACSEDDIDLAKVSKIIEKDTSLSGKIFKLVNSSHYGLPRKIESIHHCVSYLGAGSIKNIAIGASISQAFRPPKGNTLYNLKAFWWHSLRCAVLCRLIARKIRYNNPDEAFLTGLLHDIGRLVLWVNYPKEYAELLEKYNGRPDLLLAGEIRQGITHCEVGAWLLHRWNLQPFMADAILYHHESIERIKNALPLVQIVHTANALTAGLVQEKEQHPRMVEQIFGLTPSQVKELLAQADEEVGEVARLLDIEIEEPKESEVPISERDMGKQEDLAREVKDISLLLAMLQDLMEAHDEDTILSVVQQGLQILFDIREIFFFLYDAEKNCLMGKGVKENEKSAMINDLIIPLKMDSSLLVASLIQKKPIEIFIETEDPDTVIIDLQIIRFIGKEGMLCLPMLAHGEYVGVMVLGLDQFEFSHISGQFKLLKLFSRQAALALHADQMRRAPLTRIQSERAGASSDIARKVFHEVNNPLGIIKNYLKILGLKLSKQDIAQEEIAIINKEIDRIAHILRALTSFSESEIQKTGPVDVNAVLSDLVKITKESLRRHSGIEVHLDLKYLLPTIISDENSIKQIFVNLIKNAAEAMQQGGNLYIKTRHISSHFDGDPVPEGEDSQGYVEITIKDDGPGIPDEIKSRLFDPFVTSKGGDHSGLGLSIVHNLVRALNGTLTCESEKGKGTCFKVGLPLVINKKN